MKNYKMTEELKTIIASYIKVPRADTLTDISFEKPLDKIVLYPTNDLYLTESQYNAFIKFLNNLHEERFFVTQFDGGRNGIFSDDNIVWEIGQDTKYKDYYNINLFSLSMLFSQNGKWAIFIEETLDGGIGLIMGDKDSIIEFKKSYPQYSQEEESYSKVMKQQ